MVATPSTKLLDFTGARPKPVVRSNILYTGPVTEPLAGGTLSLSHSTVKTSCH